MCRRPTAPSTSPSSWPLLLVEASTSSRLDPQRSRLLSTTTTSSLQVDSHLLWKLLYNSPCFIGRFRCLSLHNFWTNFYFKLGSGQLTNVVSPQGGRRWTAATPKCISFNSHCLSHSRISLHWISLGHPKHPSVSLLTAIAWTWVIPGHPSHSSVSLWTAFIWISPGQCYLLTLVTFLFNIHWCVTRSKIENVCTGCLFNWYPP